jgi:hypothetical protein
VRGSAQQLFFGFLIGNNILVNPFGICSYLFWAFVTLALEHPWKNVPLALGPNFGPLVEFWVRLPLLKTQVHVVIALGTPRGIITKTPLTKVSNNTKSIKTVLLLLQSYTRVSVIPPPKEA